MRLIGYNNAGFRFIGIVDGTMVTPVAGASEFYANPAAALAGPLGEPRSIDSLEIEPPVPETARIFCVGLNYAAHGAESRDMIKQDVPAAPMIFGRWADTLIVDNASAPVPPNESGLDWEVELAVVIGSVARCVDREDALNHVLGYTVFNDLSARRKQLETSQFTLGKNSDHSGPIGPAIVTRDELSDISNLRLETRVGSEVMQSGNTRDMIHDVAKLIAYISDTVTLKPGDVIATGTPAGVGMGMKPPRYLQPGEVVEVEIEQIGILRTPIVAWDAGRP